MSTPRLDSNGRRTAIVDAALPLFARKGFAATTVKEIAAAAGVSEALIFKHFPSKAALFDAILLDCFEGDDELAALLARSPSTETLVVFVDGLVRHFLLDVRHDAAATDRHRLFMTSLLDDGEFARVVYRWVRNDVLPLFVASVEAAERAGDIVPAPVVPENRLWFAMHLCESIANQCLCGGGLVDYPCRDHSAARQVAWFILRGIGLTDAALARCADQLCCVGQPIDNIKAAGGTPAGAQP